MVWWRPTYPAASYKRWHEGIAFGFRGAAGHALADRHFLVNRFPEPINDRDKLRW